MAWNTRYRSSTHEELMLYAEEGIRPPGTAATGRVAEKMSDQEQKEFIELSAQGNGKDRCCKLLNVPYERFRNTYFDDSDNRFKIQVDSSYRNAIQEIAAKVHKKAIDGDKECMFDVLKRDHQGKVFGASHVERKLDRKHKEKLLQMQLDAKSDITNQLMQMVELVFDACMKHVDSNTTYRIIKELKELVNERIEDGQKQIEVEYTEQSSRENEDDY